MEGQQTERTILRNRKTDLNTVELVVIATGIGLVQRGIVNQLIVRVDVDMIAGEVAALVQRDLRCPCFGYLSFLEIGGGSSFPFGRFDSVIVFVFGRFGLDVGFASTFLGRGLLVFRLGGVGGFGFCFASALLWCQFRGHLVSVELIFGVLSLDFGVALGRLESWLLLFLLGFWGLFINRLGFWFGAPGFAGLFGRIWLRCR